MEELMQQLEALTSELETLKQKESEMKEELSALAKNLKELNGTSQFKMNGVYYQVRCRGGKSFICRSETPFGEWLKKKSE